MKKLIQSKCFYLIAIVCFCTASCQKFEPAELKLTINHNAALPNIVECKATITDDGGCKNFTEQGGIYSFYNEPSFVDKYSFIECVNNNVKETSFTFTLNLSFADTIYYVRAYVKTNAGIGYSNIVELKL